jgi:hypothetical protein
VLPPLFYLNLYKQEIAESPHATLITVANWALVVGGIGFSLATTALLIVDVIKN